jgi:hypothetical protein
MEADVIARRTALAAVVAAGFVVGGQVHLSAETPAEEGASNKQPAESGAPKPPAPTSPDAGTKSGEGAEKPAEKPSAAQRPAEDGAAKLRLVSILGREVVNREGDGGRVIDVLVDLDGRSGAVVVEFGGFLGIGSRKVAVDWSALRFVHDGNRTQVIVDVSREQIRDAAEYKPNEPPSVLGAK